MAGLSAEEHATLAEEFTAELDKLGDTTAYDVDMALVLSSKAEIHIRLAYLYADNPELEPLDDGPTDRTDPKPRAD